MDAPPGMLVTMLLADAAQAIENKLYILGGGWSVTGPEPSPSALAIALKVPWDAAGERHELRLELVDADGRPVQTSGPGSPPVALESQFEVGRPPGLRPGTPIDLALALNLGPMALPPGGRYEWRLTIDGHAESHWHAAFSTRPASG
jgi:Family of unknown function (DUF6941)